MEYSRGVRNTAGANAWRKVEGVMGDRRTSRTRKGNVLSPCVTPAYISAFETVALTEKPQEKVQVCQNNPVRIIVGVKRWNW